MLLLVGIAEPERQVAMRLGFLYEYGFLIVMGLLVTGVLGYLISPPYYVILSWLR